MLIKQVEISGFKSFADRTKLKFSKGLTAVVGPNGSGKSNVSDAVRWVLGEQSTKQLRGKSMEDVIFSGTETRKGHGFCEVTITFDNSDRTLNFDDDNVSITRRYYRSHESEYLINGNFVRLKDVHEMFMDTGLGRDGYSMIGQGKIDNIVSSKSDERRDIFEEASGISRYRYRKEESERKLNSAEENLLRLRDIESELKGRVEPLKKQSEAAEEFLKLSDEKKELEIGIWLDTLNSSKEKFRKEEGKIATVTAQYKELDNKLTEAENKIDENTKLFGELTKEIDEKRKIAGDTDQTVAELNGDINVLNVTIEHNNENILRLEKELEEIKKAFSGDDTQKAQKQQEKKEKEESLKKINEKTENLSLELSNLISKSEKALKLKESISGSLNEIAESISFNRAKILGSEDLIKETQESKNSLIKKEQEILLIKTRQEKELALLNKDLTDIEERETGALNTKKGYELKLDSKRETEQKKQEELAELENQKNSALQKANMLKELDKNMDGFSYASKEIIKAKEEKRLMGIRGVVSKLINTKSEYSVAVETALGAAAGNIVVNTDTDAKRAINYLKERRLGRATFLPLNSITPNFLTEKEVKNCSGFIGFANELLENDKEYDNIFKYLLGRTVICEDLDSAVAISKKFKYHFKTVSLDGQVVNAGGSLTGGSISKNIGILSRKDDIEKLIKKASELDKKIEIKTEELNRAKAEFNKINADIINNESVILTAKEDKIRVLGEIKRVTDLKNAVSEQLNGTKTEIALAEDKILKIKNDTENAKLLIKQCEAKQLELSGKTDIAADDTSERRNEITEELTSLRLSAGNILKDIEIINGVLSDLSLSAESREDKQKLILGEIEILKNKNSECEAEIENKTGFIEKEKENKVLFSGKSEELLNKRDLIESENVKLRALEREISEDKEKASGEIARLNERKEVMLKELDDIVAKLYDEYSLTKSEAEEMNIKIEDISAAKKRLNEIRSKIKNLGNVNVAAIEEYKEVSERYEFLSKQIEDVEKSKAELLKLINELMQQMKEMFITGFNKIGENFTKTFSTMFGGGHAELRLTNPEDILNSGIDIVANLPGKHVPSLDVLSGGEKALIAISIYFAIMQVNAPPFCFLDEVESALDDINVERFARYMKTSGLPTQFICITHRRGTMENADMLYGVTMQEKGVSKLIELNVSELEKHLKELKVE